MDANTADTRVISTGTGFINGMLFSMNATATGSSRDGTIETSWELSELPDGFSLLTLVDCTSAGVSPVFALEANGGRNFLSLAGGNYHLQRTFDYGRYGSYSMNYEIRTTGDEVRSTGVQEGRLNLPPLQSAELSLLEVLVPTGPGAISGFMQTTKTSQSGEQIPVNIVGVYTPLEGESDWALDAPPQVRHSQVEMTESADGNRLSLKYTTVIAPIAVPQLATSSAR
jgi:hypothetical protein